MRIEPSSTDISTTRSTIWKYSSLIRRSCALGGNEVVDAGAKVLEDEILLGRRLAVVDLLRPLLQRQLDADRLGRTPRDRAARSKAPCPPTGVCPYSEGRR